MDANPFEPPAAELERSGGPQAGLLPFEDPGRGGLLVRAGATLGLLLQDSRAAGAALRTRGNLGAPIGFYILMGLLPAMLVGVVQALHPAYFFWQKLLGAPPPGPPDTLRIVSGLAGALLMGPIGAAVGLGLSGLLQHAGLWLCGGTRGGFGLSTTFRTLFYVQGVVGLLLLPFNLLQLLPGQAGFALQYLFMALSLGTSCWHGLVLARAHDTEGWRGQGAVWLPIILIFGCIGGCIAAAWYGLGPEFQDAMRQAMRGGR